MHFLPPPYTRYYNSLILKPCTLVGSWVFYWVKKKLFLVLQYTTVHAGSVTVIGVKNRIGVQSSNSDRVYYVHFRVTVHGNGFYTLSFLSVLLSYMVDLDL